MTAGPLVRALGCSTATAACRSSACSPPWRVVGPAAVRRSARRTAGRVRRHAALGRRRLARLPRRHERRRGRPGARRVAGQRRLLHRLLRVPRRPAADRLPRHQHSVLHALAAVDRAGRRRRARSPATCGRCGPPNPEPTKHVFAPPPRDLRSYRGGVARLLRAHRPLVRRHLPRGPDAGAGAGLAGHRARRERPDPGADRLRQDAGGVPAVPSTGSAPTPPTAPACGCSTSRRSRRWPTTSSATCAGRSPASARRPSACGVHAARGRASPCAPATRPRATASSTLREPAGRPDHHARVPVPAAHLAARARDAARRRDRHRRRDPRGRRRPSAARTSRSRSSGCEHLVGRPVQRIGCRRPSGRSRRSRASSAATARSRSSTPAARRSSTCEVVVPVGGHGGAARARPDRPERRPGRQPLDLAGDLPAAARARAGAPLDDRVRQLPPARRAAGAAAQRAGRRGASRAPTTARSRARPRVEIEEALKAGQLRCLVATSSLELGIDMGAIDLVVQVESPGASRAGCSASAAPATTSASPAAAASSRSSAATSSSAPWSSTACARARSRPPACRATRSTCSPSRSWRCARSRSGRSTSSSALVRRAYPLPRPAAPAARGRARHARRPLPVRRVRRAAPAHRLGPRRERPARAGPTRGRWPWSTPAPSPTAASTACSWATAPAASASSTRRWSTRRASGQTFLLGASTWRIEHITRDRVIVSPAPGRARPDPVLARRGRRAARSSSAARSARSCARSRRCPRRAPASGCATGTRSTSWRGENLLATSPSSARRPACCRPTAPSSSSASATRSATGACASSPRSAAGCTRRGRWRSARGCATSTASTTQALWSDDGIVLHLPDADDPPPGDVVAPTPTRSRTCRPRARRLGAVRRPLPRERRPRAADPAPPAGPAHAAVAAAAEGAVAAAARGALRLVPDRARDLSRGACRTCSTSRACVDAAATPLRRREVSLVEVETPTASPFARSLLFDYVAQYMYEGDAPPPSARRRR